MIRAPMRLLVVVHPYPPVPSVGSNRWGAMVKWLRRDGHHVHVVTTDAFGPLPPGEELETTRTTDLMALPWLRRAAGLGPLAKPGVAAPAPPVPGLLTQTIVPDAFLLSWVPTALRGAFRAARRDRFDAVVTSSPAESVAFVGLALKRRLGLPWIADFRDGWIFEPIRPPMPTAPQRWLDRALERGSVRRADAVIAATRPIAEDFRARLGVPAVHVPNGWDVDLDATLPQPSPAPLADGHVDLVLTGKLTGIGARDPRPLFAAMRRLRTDEPAIGSRLRLVLAGPQDTRDADLIAESGLGDAIRHLGILPREEALALQRRAGALVLLTSPNAGEATGKLFEYLTAGRPILALAAGNEAARIVRETGTGVAVDPRDEPAVVSAVRAVATGELESAYDPRGLEPYIYPGPARQVVAVAEAAIRRRRSAR